MNPKKPGNFVLRKSENFGEFSEILSSARQKFWFPLQSNQTPRIPSAPHQL